MESYTPSFHSVSAPPPGSFSAGFARGSIKAEATPRALIGYGPGGPRATAWTSNVFPIRALVLDDGKFGRLGIVVIEAWSASTYVLERTAEILQTPEFDGVHIGREQLSISGTHTHCSPGGFYESPYYSRLAEPWPFVTGFDKDVADALALSIARTLKAAVSAPLVDAELAFVEGTFAGSSVNRSLPAHAQNGGNAGSATPRTGVDQRLPLVLVRERSTKKLRAVLGAVNCHATARTKDFASPDTDFIGHAGRKLETNSDVLYALAAGVIGDADPLPAQLEQEQYLEERKSLGLTARHVATLGDALADAVSAAVAQAGTWKSDVKLEGLQTAAHAAGATVGAVKLPAKPRVGSPVIGGSELGRGFEVYTEGTTAKNPQWADPQAPKDSDSDALIAIVNTYLGGQSEHLNLTVLKLGVCWMIGLPGEPTTQFSFNLRAHLKSAFPTAPPIVICGVNGGYNGYFVTEPEYRAQHYEGASCLWGRHTEAFIAQEVTKLAKGRAIIRRNQSIELKYELEDAAETPFTRARKFGFELVQFTDRAQSDLTVFDAGPASPLRRPRTYRPFAKKQLGPGWKLLFLIPVGEVGKRALLNSPRDFPLGIRTLDTKLKDLPSPDVTLRPELEGRTFELERQQTLTDW
jgi:neutral ceramidase